METKPFSFPIDVRKLPSRGKVKNYEAPADVCDAIASSLDLISVENFAAESVVAPWRKQGVKVTGAIKARITQACAVTGEPLVSDVEEEVDAIYVPEGSRLARPQVDQNGEIILDPNGDDAPETFSGDELDLADVWLEFLVLGIDPFARKEGAVFSVGVDGGSEVFDDAGKQSNNPFAVLNGLKTD